MKLIIIIGVLFLTVPSVHARTRCNPTEKKLKSCLIKFKKYRMKISSDKLILTDGVWRSVLNLPLTEKNAVWNDVKIQFFNDRTFLDFRSWDEPKGVGRISSLHWYLLEIKSSKMKEVLHKIIRKKRVTEEGKHLLDPREKFGLKFKKKKLYWWAGRESGTI